MLFSLLCGCVLNPGWFCGPYLSNEAWQKWNIKAWAIGVLPASTWCSSCHPPRKLWKHPCEEEVRHCLTVLDKLPVVHLHQHVSYANQDIPSWVPDFMESTLWTLFCHAWFLDCQKHEGCFQSLSFGIICHLGINDRTEDPCLCE